MTYYYANGDELDDLATRQGESAIFFAVGAFVLPWAIDLTKDLVKETMDSATHTTWVFLTIILYLVSFFLFGMGWLNRHRATNKATKIKTRPIP